MFYIAAHHRVRSRIDVQRKGGKVVLTRIYEGVHPVSLEEIIHRGWYASWQRRIAGLGRDGSLGRLRHCRLRDSLLGSLQDRARGLFWSELWRLGGRNLRVGDHWRCGDRGCRGCASRGQQSNQDEN